MPAWLLEPRQANGRWAVLVHGRAARREECLRALPALLRLGFTCLVVTYRNDPTAPPAPDGRYNLGLSEWRDVESALEYAAAAGASGVVLGGWSMGGAVVLQTLIDCDLNERWAAGDVNPNGGGISLGHPLGATGARITATLLAELDRRDARYGLACMCIGQGQAIAAVIERL